VTEHSISGKLARYAVILAILDAETNRLQNKRHRQYGRGAFDQKLTFRALVATLF
jgi:hypothetical protein